MPRWGFPSKVSARSLTRALVTPPLEVALELARDRLPGGLRQVGGVPGLLEGAHVVGDVLVLLRELVDAALPGTRVLGQVAERDADLEQVLQLADQGERRLRAGRLRDVVRHRRPVADR